MESKTQPSPLRFLIAGKVRNKRQERELTSPDQFVLLVSETAALRKLSEVRMQVNGKGRN